MLLLERIEKYASRHLRRVKPLRKKVTDVLTRLNKDAEEAEKVVSLQWTEFGGHVNIVAPKRRVLKRGTLRRVVGKGSGFFGRAPTSARFEIILLNDLLLCAQYQSGAREDPLK